MKSAATAVLLLRCPRFHSLVKAGKWWATCTGRPPFSHLADFLALRIIQGRGRRFSLRDQGIEQFAQTVSGVCYFCFDQEVLHFAPPPGHPARPAEQTEYIRGRSTVQVVGATVEHRQGMPEELSVFHDGVSEQVAGKRL